MTMRGRPATSLLLPPGTQVVIQGNVTARGQMRAAGTVGVIVDAPIDATHAYRVRLVDGTETMLHRSQLSIRRHVQSGPLVDHSQDLRGYDLYEYVVFRCVVGSQAYGLSGPHSDIDRRGIYLPPAELHWSLYGVPEQLEDQEHEEVYWEMQKFLSLALKANPNVLECLYTPLVEVVKSPVEELLRARDMFLSKLVYSTYNGYVLSQFKKIEQDLRINGEIRWKHAMHLIRLLNSGITILREGLVPLDVGIDRDRLLAIRSGLVQWDEIDAWRLELHRTFDRAYEQTHLPERPDYTRANAFLVDARRNMVS